METKQKIQSIIDKNQMMIQEQREQITNLQSNSLRSDLGMSTVQIDREITKCEKTIAKCYKAIQRAEKQLCSA
ncbi:hypothetical protein J6A31_06470 [bacterium]|nr:hypothetical protein [bacterium]